MGGEAVCRLAAQLDRIDRRPGRNLGRAGLREHRAAQLVACEEIGQELVERRHLRDRPASSSFSQISLRVGKDGHGVGESLERDLADDGDRRGVQHLGDLDAGERRAGDDVTHVVDDEP